MAAPQPPAGQPPRFVPTLTEVVQIDAMASEAQPAAVLPAAALPPPPSAALLQVPPRPAAQAGSPVALTPNPQPLEPTAQPTLPALPDGIEEYIVHRVMQRVDVVLDHRLREAIAAVVQEQTRSLVPRLREEVESVVRHAVYEAVADELTPRRVPPL